MNVVDSCGWLEYFGDGNNADFFAPVIENTADLIVPLIVVFEVSRKLRQKYGDAGESNGIEFLKKGRLIAGDMALMRHASIAARLYKLAMADAIIWQTAQTHNSQLYTQDADLQGLPNVQFKQK